MARHACDYLWATGIPCCCGSCHTPLYDDAPGLLIDATRYLNLVASLRSSRLGLVDAYCIKPLNSCPGPPPQVCQSIEATLGDGHLLAITFNEQFKCVAAPDFDTEGFQDPASSSSKQDPIRIAQGAVIIWNSVYSIPWTHLRHQSSIDLLDTTVHTNRAYAYIPKMSSKRSCHLLH